MESFQRFANDAATAFSRARQYTEEKIGHSEKTQYDPQFENLQRRADRTKVWTEKLCKQMENVLQPNPTVRMEEFFLEKLDKKKRPRLTNHEVLGQLMTSAGNDYGPNTALGGALIKVGNVQAKIGLSEREFVETSARKFIKPCKTYIENDCKSISKERKLLAVKRLDLDACKSKLKKAVSTEKAQAADNDLRAAQSEFDRQHEITKLMLDGVGSTHTNQLRSLGEFVEAQLKYYLTSYRELIELQKQLNSTDAFAPNATVGTNSTSRDDIANEEISPLKPAVNVASRAKVLYDYDAANASELSLLADEIITVLAVPGMDEDWIMAERGNQRGKVPTTYIQILS
ncbi:Endophilin-B1 [Trichoplax sp. H2]|nr:Endophilin-B1 [Trichoplax sp. H2]|eukprot:RDD45389.1 Endophilin-B1 [Trichoplax sp. H2]